MTTEITQSRFRPASTAVAVLGAFALVLMAAWVLLTCLTGDLQASRDGAAAGRLKDAVDLNPVRDDLASVVDKALEPVHISAWISPRD